MERDESCPEDIKERALILAYNSLVGFQAPGDGSGSDAFVICWCEDLTNEQVDKIKEVSNCCNIEHGDYLGRGYIKVKWYDYNKIPDIFNAMLQCGHWFRTTTKSQAGF